MSSLIRVGKKSARLLFPAMTRRFSIKPAKTLEMTNNKSLFNQQITIDGQTVNFVETGGNKDNVLLCIPGGLGSIEADFLPLLNEIDDTKVRIVAWDPPGYGLSRPPILKDFTPGFLSRESHLAVKLMQRLGYQKFSIFGHSAGGHCGVYAASVYKNTVKKLITCGMMGFFDHFIVEQIHRWRDLGIEGIPFNRREVLLRQFGVDGLTHLIKRWCDGHLEDAEYTGKTCGGRFSTDSLAKLECPYLIIHGEDDRLSKVSHAHYVHSFVGKDSRMMTIPGGSHNVHVTSPKVICKAVEAFLDD